MITQTLIATALSATLTFSVWAAESAERAVTLDSIPPAAAKALKAQAGGEKIKTVSKEKDEGKTVYEASFSKKGRTQEVTVDGSGKLISVEETIPLAEAPEPVRAAIKREHPEGKVDKFERVTEGGKTKFEALISSKGRRKEITFDGNGKVLERENKTGAKGKD